MPHADAEERREYQREYQRRRRAGLTGGKPSSPDLIPDPLRIQTAGDVLRLLEWALNLVWAEKNADNLARARTIGYLAGVTLKAVEVSDLEERVRALETVLKARDKR